LRAFAGLVFLQHAVHATPRAQPIDFGKGSAAGESACDVALVSASGAAESKLNETAPLAAAGAAAFPDPCAPLKILTTAPF